MREAGGQTAGRFGKLGKGAGRPMGGCGWGKPGKDAKGRARPKVEKSGENALSKGPFVRNWSLFWANDRARGPRRICFWGAHPKTRFIFGLSARYLNRSIFTLKKYPATVLVWGGDVPLGGHSLQVAP